MHKYTARHWFFTSVIVQLSGRMPSLNEYNICDAISRFWLSCGFQYMLLILSKLIFNCLHFYASFFTCHNIQSDVYYRLLFCSIQTLYNSWPRDVQQLIDQRYKQCVFVYCVLCDGLVWWGENMQIVLILKKQPTPSINSFVFFCWLVLWIWKNASLSSGERGKYKLLFRSIYI